MDVLIQSGWLDETEEGLFIHDWATWQEYWYKAVEKREYDRQYQQRRKQSTQPQNGQMQMEGVASDTPEPAEEEGSKYSKAFEAFWAAYPRKRDKGLAYAKYKARRNDGWSDEELLTAAKNYAAQCRRKGTEQEYIKHAKTFLSENTPFVDFLPKKPEPKPDDGGNPFAE